MMHIMPYPNFPHEIEAQFEAMFDPESGKDSVLLTPGSALPRSKLGSNVCYRRNLGKFGVLFTVSPRVTELVDVWERQGISLTDALVGKLLFGEVGAFGFPATPNGILIALNFEGARISELVVDTKELEKFAIAEATMYSHAGAKGSVILHDFNSDIEMARAKEAFIHSFGKIPLSLQGMIWTKN